MDYIRLRVSQRSDVRGMSLVMVLVAAAALAGLAVVVSAISKNISQTAYSAKISGAAANIESSVRVALTQTKALQFSKNAAANSSPISGSTLTSVGPCLGASPVAACLGVTGPDLGFELRDASDVVVVSKASTGVSYLNDGGLPCSPLPATSLNRDCQWRLSSTITPKGDATSFTISVTLDLAQTQNAPFKVPFKTRVISVTVDKSMFTSALFANNCPTGQFVSGIQANGALSCTPLPVQPQLFGSPCNCILVPRTVFIQLNNWNTCAPPKVMVGVGISSLPGPSGTIAWVPQIKCCEICIGP